MVTISIIGVDPYLVRQISKAMTDKISNIYEISKDDVNFYAPECLYIHDGVEQNTWNVLVKVNAPIKAKIMEKDELRNSLPDFPRNLFLRRETLGFGYAKHFVPDMRNTLFQTRGT